MEGMRYTSSDKMVMASIADRVAFEHRPKGSEGVQVVWKETHSM